MVPVLKKVKAMERFLRYSSRAFLRDSRNRILYGPEAPRYAERIWVNPQACTECLYGIGDRYSGRVVEGAWPPAGCRLKSLMEIEKLRGCIDHWSRGIPWEETGIFRFLEGEIEKHPRRVFDDCRSREDLEKRYAGLDLLFERVKADMRLRTSREVNPWAFRERGGISFHVGPEGRLFFGGNGCHRFGMALVLGLTRIPAKIGCVHISAIPLLGSLRE